MITAIAFPVIEAARVLLTRPQIVLYGDQALIDLGARRAAHFQQLLGPYSRNGFHHPGPVVLYLLAPFLHLAGGGGAGLYLGALAINASAMLATAAIMWRVAGPIAAAWAAGCINLLCLCIGVGTFREPWNPYLIVVPMVLFVVLWAMATTGSRPAAAWACAVGMYEVQTHIATAPLVLTMVVLMVMQTLVSRLRRGRLALRASVLAPGVASGILALALVSAPALVELWSDGPNNLQLMWRFFRSPHASTAVGQALRVVAEAVSILPFGNHDYVLALHRSAIELVVSAALITAGLLLAIGVARRRHQPMASALATAAVLGLVVGGGSLTHSNGPVYLYFAVWLAFVPLCVLLAIGVALFAPPSAATDSSPTRTGCKPGNTARLPSAVGILAVLAALTTGYSDLHTGSVAATTGSGPWPAAYATTIAGKSSTVRETASLIRAAEKVLRTSDHCVSLTLASTDVWPYAAGIVLALDERNVRTTVAPATLELYLGPNARTPSPTVRFRIYPSLREWKHDGSPGVVIADDSGVLLSYERNPG